jgi:hypothetical protein
METNIHLFYYLAEFFLGGKCFIQRLQSGFGSLGVACWPLVPKFTGSNQAEAVGFLG